MWVLCLTTILSVEGKYLIEGLRTAIDIEYFSIVPMHPNELSFISIQLCCSLFMRMSFFLLQHKSDQLIYFYLLKCLEEKPMIFSVSKSEKMKTY